jgi:hypothetical protein
MRFSPACAGLNSPEVNIDGKQFSVSARSVKSKFPSVFSTAIMKHIMKNKLFITLVAASLLAFWGQRVFCAEKTDAKAELQELERKINDKFNEGKLAPKDFAEELKEIDTLLTRHKDEKTDEVANIFLLKAMLFFKVFKDADKGVALVRQVKRDFPATAAGKRADDILASIPIHYNGQNAPSLEIIQENVLRHGGETVKDIKVVGLHKEREGAYLVITDRNSNAWGGPYSLLRLESNDWVMNKPGSLFTEYVFIVK